MTHSFRNRIVQDDNNKSEKVEGEVVTQRLHRIGHLPLR